MKLKGVLDFAFENFLCLRGYAPMSVLEEYSAPDPSFQRDLLTEHRAEMLAFLRKGSFLFFPKSFSAPPFLQAKRYRRR